MKTPAVQTQNLCKSFRVYNRPIDRLREWISRGQKTFHTDFHALNGVDFAVNQGECVGLIGPNGAGKSTLLRILSQTLTPTSGTFEVTGRTLSLLELGTGFNPELTGRANVIHTAQLLGLPSDYAKPRMADIEQFADLGAFIDRPIKTYSTGMTLRLAFSMFAFFEPDVLIIDEALAVGDAAFQRKCYRRLEELVADARRAAILVSHDLQSIIKFCNRVYWIDHGTIRQQGDPQTVAQEYLRSLFAGDRAGMPPAKSEVELSQTSNIEHRTSNIEPNAAEIPVDGRLPRSPAAIVYPSAGVELLALWLEDSQSTPATSVGVDQPFSICYALHFHQSVDRPVFGIRLATTRGDVMIATNTQMMQMNTGQVEAARRVVIRWPIAAGLSVGDYFISCGCSLEDDLHHFLMREVDGYQFSVTGVARHGGLCSLTRAPDLFFSK